MNSEFGISFSGSIENLKNISAVLNKSKFKILDMGGDCLVPGAWKNSMPIRIESIDDIISPMDIRALMNQKASFRRRFLIEFEKKADLIQVLGAKYASLDFGIENCVGDMFYYDELVDLMKRISAIFLRRKISLCLPVRAPLVVKEVDPEFYRALLTDIMFPNCLLAIEIFPHEFKKKEELYDSMRKYRFDLGIVKIKYEMRSGNLVSEKLFREISAALELVPSQPPCFFDPMIYEFTPMRAEITRISEFILN
jgi:hypothetical protein